MRLIIMASVLAFSLLGCASAGKSTQQSQASAPAKNTVENPYINSYTARKIPAIALQPDPSGPHIYRGADETGDYQRMLENGFDMLGYSKFEAADVPPEQLNEQARLVKADLVLIYTNLTGGMPASVAVNKIREQSKMTEEQKRLAGNGKMLPKEQALYEYFATYWVKLAPPLIGVHVKGPSEDENIKGLTVVAVVKKSPADRAAIAKDDVLMRIGDMEMLQPEALSAAAKRYAGQTVSVALHRGDNDLTLPITLNSKN